MKLMRLVLGVVCWLAMGAVALGYVASSENYRLQADSLNAGGLRSTSASYRLEDTIGDIATSTKLTSSTYRLYAGFQQMIHSYLSLSVVADIGLASLNAGTGGQSSGAATWEVTTDQGTYTLTITAGSSPALQSAADSFPDYSSSPTYGWSVSSGASAFGFSPAGSHIATAYRNNGSSCGTGNVTTGNCWDGLSTSAQTIAGSAFATGVNISSSFTHSSTTVSFQAEVAAGSSQAAETYQANITVTATAT